MGKDKVGVIDVNGMIVIGTRTDNIIVGCQIAAASKIGSDEFANYLKAKNMDELITLEAGKNRTIITRDFTRREKLDFKMVQAEWDEAVDMAENQLVNDVFDQFRGKR